MKTFNIEFRVVCQTSFGEMAVITGNLAQLGHWNPLKALRMQTDSKNYPRWICHAPVCVMQGLEVEFKLCIVDGNGKIVRWEAIGGNRCFIPKQSVLVEFVDSNMQMSFVILREHHQPSNDLNHHSEEINSLGDESNPEHQAKRNSNLLTEFALQMTKAVTTQKEDSFFGFYPQQVQPQLDLFSDSYNHHSHYVITNEAGHNQLCFKYSNDTLRYINRQCLPRLQLQSNNKISFFHLLYETSFLVEVANEVSQHWKRASNNQMRGLIIAYLEQEANLGLVEDLIESGVRVFITASNIFANIILEALVHLDFALSMSQSDVFIGRKNSGQQVKLIVRNFGRKQILSEDLEEQFVEVKSQILKQFYFCNDTQQFENEFENRMSIWNLWRSQSLIILHIQRLQELKSETIAALVRLTSAHSKVYVFVITNEKLAHNIHHRFHIASSNIIFLSTHGELYGGFELINIFFFLEVNRNSFEANQAIILEELGAGLSKHYWKDGSLVLNFPRNTLGDILKMRALQLTKDVNNKSIAKLIPHLTEHSLHLIPFCLHPSFLYRVILTTFSLKLTEPGIVIAIDSTDLSAFRYLDVAETPQKLMLLTFFLHGSQQSSYPCYPINEQKLQHMVSLIASIREKAQSKIDTFHEVQEIACKQPNHY